MTRLVTSLISILIVFASSAEAFFIERRATKAHDEFGYFLYPLAGRIGGIGFGYGGAAMLQNFWRSTDASVIGITGDAEAAAATISQIRPWDETLSFDASIFSTRLPIRIYDRGMDSNQLNYYKALVKESGGSGSVRLSFWEKRLQAFFRAGSATTQVQRIFAPSGEDFYNIDSGTKPTLYTRAGIMADITDSDTDPHEGLKLELTRTEAVIDDPTLSRWHTYHASATGYVPIGGGSTWAFNAYRARAYVTEQVQMSEAELATRMSLNCNQISDSGRRNLCLEEQTRRAHERAHTNRQGNAGYLGGPAQLRAFPVNRFHGSETLFYGTELRWNLTSEEAAFDVGFAKGVRTHFQVAIFSEWGAVSDFPTGIESVPLRPSYGAGFRMVFSGAVIRADMGFGEEGQELTLFFGYPWGIPVL